MFNFSWSKKKEKLIPESVKQAEKLLPDVLKNLSIPNLAKKINELNRPSKWAITRFAASGKLDKKYIVGGNYYPPNQQSERQRQRRLRQIEKGIIQVTPIIGEAT